MLAEAPRRRFGPAGQAEPVNPDGPPSAIEIIERKSKKSDSRCPTAPGSSLMATA
jgi:hypothetical protein